MKASPKASRRGFTMLAAAAVFGPTRSAVWAAPAQQGARRLLNADQALRELLDGNHRPAPVRTAELPSFHAAAGGCAGPSAAASTLRNAGNKSARARAT